MFTLKNIAVPCLAGLLIVAGAGRGQAQTKESGILDRRVEAVTISEVNIVLALAHIADEYDIPIGLEVAAAHKEPKEKKIDISIEKGSLRDLLEAIVAQDSRYSWKIIDGVVNVYPRANRDTLLNDLLDTRIQEFLLAKNTSLYRIRYSIVELPEIKSKLEKAEVTAYTVAYTRMDFARLGEFSMRVSNVTLRELMNRIVRESDVKFWILNRFGKNNELLILNF